MRPISQKMWILAISVRNVNGIFSEMGNITSLVFTYILIQLWYLLPVKLEVTAASPSLNFASLKMYPFSAFLRQPSLTFGLWVWNDPRMTSKLLCILQELYIMATTRFLVKTWWFLYCDTSNLKKMQKLGILTSFFQFSRTWPADTMEFSNLLSMPIWYLGPRISL